MTTYERAQGALDAARGWRRKAHRELRSGNRQRSRYFLHQARANLGYARALMGRGRARSHG